MAWSSNGHPLASGKPSDIKGGKILSDGLPKPSTKDGNTASTEAKRDGAILANGQALQEVDGLIAVEGQYKAGESERSDFTPAPTQ